MSTTSALPRYLGYMTLPGWCRSELCEYDSLREAARDLVDRARSASYNDVPYVDLYRVDGHREMVDAAREFEEIGVPFDYMDYRITLGPRKGASIRRA
jgi:hypothetical protein